MSTTKFKTKSGEELIIRIANENDAAGLLKLKLDYLQNTNSIPLYPREYTNEVEQEALLIKKLAVERNSVLFVAEWNDELVGNIDLSGNQRIKLHHTGVVGMGIKEDWRGKGVGEALMKAVIDWSQHNPLIHLLWLEVYDSNLAGKSLYRKTGFKECGRIKNYFREEELFIDKITMVKHL